MVLDIGTTTDAATRQLDFTVTEYTRDAITLEKVWGTLHLASQKNWLDAVVRPMDKIHNTGPGALAHILVGTPQRSDLCVEFSNHSIGSPATGYTSNIKKSLQECLATTSNRQRHPTLMEEGDRTVLESEYEDIEQILLFQLDLNELRKIRLFSAIMTLSHVIFSPRTHPREDIG